MLFGIHSVFGYLEPGAGHKPAPHIVPGPPKVHKNMAFIPTRNGISAIVYTLEVQKPPPTLVRKGHLLKDPIYFGFRDVVALMMRYPDPLGNMPPLRGFWSLSDCIWGILEAGSGVLEGVLLSEGLM